MSSQKPDYLVDDSQINNQTFACVSLITPATLKGCSKHLLKVRGVYGNKQRAEDRCKEIHAKDSTFGVYVVDVGKWIAWSDDQNVDANSSLNELMELYKEERSNSKLLHEKRKEELKNNPISTSNAKLTNAEETSTVDNSTVTIEENVTEESSTEQKKISYLKEDDEISNQKYYCVSFLTPDQLEDTDAAKQFSVRGFKVRGMFNNEDDAKAHCAKLHNNDKNHNIYVANMGHWVNWNDNTENAEDFEYSNKDLNKLMKAHKENQEKAKEFSEEQKKQLMNESMSNLENTTNVSSIVNEIIEETCDEDIDIDEITKQSEDMNLKEVDKELEEAKKLYDKLLKEQGKDK